MKTSWKPRSNAHDEWSFWCQRIILYPFIFFLSPDNFFLESFYPVLRGWQDNLFCNHLLWASVQLFKLKKFSFKNRRCTKTVGKSNLSIDVYFPGKYLFHLWVLDRSWGCMHLKLESFAMHHKNVSSANRNSFFWIFSEIWYQFLFKRIS